MLYLVNMGSFKSLCGRYMYDWKKKLLSSKLIFIKWSQTGRIMESVTTFKQSMPSHRRQTLETEDSHARQEISISEA